MSSKKRNKRKENEEIVLPIPVGRFSGITSTPVIAAFAILLFTVMRLSGLGVLATPILSGIATIWIASSVYGQSGGKKDPWAWGTPALALITSTFLYYSVSYDYPLDADYPYFAISAAIFTLFYALAQVRTISFESSAVTALFISAIIIHLVPAVSHNLMGDLDSYWRLKWMEGVYDNGYPTEFDPLTYPMMGGLAHHEDFAKYTNPNDGLGFGLTQKDTPMLMELAYAAIALMMKPFGFSLYQTAMLVPGIFAAPIVVLMYLLVKELFSGMRPYNQIAAFLAGFMYMLTPVLAAKVIATNCENEAFGMFLMLSTLYLFFAAFHRKSFRYAILCGFTMLMLRMVWSGIGYTLITIGIFGTLYSIVNFIRNRNAMEHLPYLVIPLPIYLSIGVFAHARGGLPIFNVPGSIESYPMIVAIATSIFLEFIRTRKNGLQLIGDATLEGRTADWAERNINTICAVGAVIFIASLLFYTTPTNWINFINSAYHAASGKKSLVHQTVSEQNPMATSFGEYISQGYRQYGIAVYLSIIAIPAMAYLAITEGSVGAIFLLAWGLPMMYAAYNRSVWVLGASASVIALSASLGLFVALKKSRLNAVTAVGTILSIIIIPAYVPMFGPFLFGQSVGYVVMHMGPSSDIYMWQPMLEWHYNNTRQGDAILTWWDYGHWITAVARRPVIADGLQADYYQIQDVARMFMNKTTEEESFEMIRAYDRAYKEHNQTWGLNYAAIDWTMIGKASALHFIATGNIENATPGAWGNYAQCQFLPDQSRLDDQVTAAGGTFSKEKQLVFGCQNGMGLLFIVTENNIKEVNVIVGQGQLIPWSQWMKQQDASILGVQPLMRNNDQEKVPSILFCAMNWKSLQGGSICRLPQFTNLIYVPQQFQDYLMTRIYLGKYIDEYAAAGLYNRPVVPLKHFREVPDYNNDGTPDGEFSFGYVRSYEISYEGFKDTQQ
ncbi:MAG: STT3 domain-containing protein [Candidatus Altiarchaeota archaeon]